jgi:hypothetical protein
MDKDKETLEIDDFYADLRALMEEQKKKEQDNERKGS